jgi:class 3 adenylate cyclase
MSCGAGVGLTCANCNASIPDVARFCPSCGTPVPQDAPASTEMIKLVSILFADVVGSTAQHEKMSPEETRSSMARFFEAMSQEIRAEGGTIERLIGDAIMADFGVPIAREDDASRAVRAAKRMLKRLDELNDEMPPDAHLAVRIGINTGEVSTGGSYGEQLMVMGDAVNVAARLQQSAEPGKIVVGARTARAVRNEFELRALVPLDLRGKSEPLEAFAIGDEIPEPQRVSKTTEAPFIGRAVELQSLVDVFERVKTSSVPHLVTVIGDPGIGKSRLAMEFIEGVDEAKSLTGRCLPYGDGVTLWAFRDIVRGETGILGTDDRELALSKLVEYVRAFAFPDDVWSLIADSMAETMGLRQSTNRDPRDAYRQLLKAWRALLERIATPNGAVVLVEDLHWADEATLGVIEDLLDHCDAPVLFLCTARPELATMNPEWLGRIKRYTAVAVEPLDATESRELITALMPVPESPLEPRILQKAEGNPFFLEEIVNELNDRGVFTHPSAQQEDIELPDTAHSVLLSRIDLLPEDEKRALRIASVLGRTFWPGALASIDGFGDIEPILRELVRKQLIVEKLSSSVADQAEFKFKHVLIRDVAYESLPRPERGRAHRAVAKWIEATRGDRAAEVSELLAFHYDRAHEWLSDEPLRTQARTHYMAAARDAVRRFAISHAESLGSRAVELSPSGKERVEALEALGDIYMLTFKSDGAWSAFNESLAEIDRGGLSDDLAVARLAGKAALVPTRWRGTMNKLPEPETIEALIARGISASSERDPFARSQLLAARAFFAGVWQRGEEEGEEAAREAVTFAVRAKEADLRSLAMDALVCCLIPQGRWGEVDRVHEDRVGLVPSLSDSREACDAFAMAAVSGFYVGNYRSAAEQATRCIERARGVDAGSYLQGLVWRTSSRFMLGEWDAALADQLEIERLQAEEASDLPGALAMRAYGMAAFIRELRGEAKAAEADFELFRRFQKEAASPSLLGHLPAFARALSHRGEFDEARSLLSTERSHNLSGHLEALCDVVADEGDWDAASGILDLARAEVDRGELRALISFADRLEGRLAEANDDLAGAERALRNAAEGFARLGCTWDEACSLLLIAEILDRKGDSDRAGYAASAAGRVFERLGSSLEMKRAARLAAQPV